VTVLEVIQRSADFLARKEVESPRLQAELLLAHVLHLPRLKLYLDFERVLSEPDLDRVRALVKRRGAREPLQYLTGSTSFCGREFRLTPAVLIPRPETEQLAERAWTALAEVPTQPASVLDFGTGSGCLAVTLALRCPTAIVHAVEVSPAALEIARANAQLQGVADRLQFHGGDGFAALPETLRFEMIVANPPYIPTPDLARLPPEVRDHEPHLALDGGPDGLDFSRRLAAQAPSFLAPGACLLLELGDHQAAAAQALFAAAGWRVEPPAPDLSGRMRFLTAHWPGLPS
jgi:release factor glutamine methyltransferase